MKNNNTTFRLAVILFTSLVLLTSCATTLNVQVTRPAKYNLNGAKTISVLPFNESKYDPLKYYYDGERETSFSDFYGSYAQVVHIEEKIINEIKNGLESGLKYSPYLTLIDSYQVQNALKYSRSCPADVYIVGDIVTFKVTDKELKIKKELPPESYDDPDLDFGPNTIKSPDNKYYYKFLYNRTVQLIFNYQIIDSKNGQAIGYDTKRFEETSGNYESMEDLPDIYRSISYEIDTFIEDLLKGVQPYTVNKSITLLKDDTKNPLMERADKLAKDGYLKESYNEFSQVYAQTKQMEAGYNAAMILMAMGDLNKAETLMTEVYSVSGSRKALDGLYDIRSEIKQAERLKNQIK